MRPFNDSEALVPESSKVHESGEKSAAEIIAECDPGVRLIVKALFAEGFSPTDSGDGAKTDMDCALDFPHVAGVFLDQGEDRDCLSIMEQHADDIAEAASAQAGAPWDCEVSWSTADRQWTWFAHPAEAVTR